MKNLLTYFKLVILFAIIVIVVSIFAFYGYREIIDKIAISDTNTTVEYSNPDKRISMILPYNGDWKFLDKKTEPYEENDGNVRYGQYIDMDNMGAFERTGWFRFEDSKDAKLLLKELKNEEYKYIEPRLRHINGLEIVEYAYGEYCSGIWGSIVIGENFNINFIEVCGDEDSLKNFEEIIKTIQFTDNFK